MVADPMTKYLTYPVWNRHMHYLQNRLGPVPPYPGKGLEGCTDMSEDDSWRVKA